MALTSNNLKNGGMTPHYQFQYDDSLVAGGTEPARTNAVIDACEADFNQMSAWFGNIALDVDFRIPVNVTPAGGGAAWGLSGRSLTVTIKPANGDSAFVRYLLVSEMVEQFMRAQGKGWFGAGTEGSQGEGLSRFLAAQFLAINGLGATPAGFGNSNTWLSSSRADFVNNIQTGDDGPDAATGCSLLFIYYLFSQLGFSTERIVAAAANTLAGVYRNLTRTFVDPFPHFEQLVDSYFPGASTITSGDLDNPFPLPDVLSVPSQIFWHNAETNETQIWFYDGHRVARRGTVLGEDGNPAFVGPPFTIVAVADFDADNKQDVLWHNAETNEIQIWFMDGNKVTRRGTVVDHGNPAFVGAPWRIVGAGDFGGDGRADILWHNMATNEIRIWIMDGNNLLGQDTVLGEDGNPAFVGAPWRIVGVADFGGFGHHADILWHNSETHETQIWLMDRNKVIGRRTVAGDGGSAIFIGPPWRIVGAADYNGDGMADILWHNSETNEVQIWFMDQERLKGRATVLGEDLKPALVGFPFSIVGAGDFDTSDTADVLWHNSDTHETQIWFMERNRVAARGNGARRGRERHVHRAAVQHRRGWGLQRRRHRRHRLAQRGDPRDADLVHAGQQAGGPATVLGEDGNPVFIGPPWTIVGAADFNGNGMADILWHNSDSQETQIWFMDNNRLAARGTVLGEDGNAALVGPPWRIVGGGDFNGNGMGDILWHNSDSQETQIWFMDGNRIAARETVLGEDGSAVFIGPPWSIVAVGDFDLDGNADILWHHADTNETQAWFMKGSRLASRGTVLGEDGGALFVGSPWNIVGAGPFG